MSELDDRSLKSFLLQVHHMAHDALDRLRASQYVKSTFIALVLVFCTHYTVHSMFIKYSKFGRPKPKVFSESFFPVFSNIFEYVYSILAVGWSMIAPELSTVYPPCPSVLPVEYTDWVPYRGCVEIRGVKYRHLIRGRGNSVQSGVMFNRQSFQWRGGKRRHNSAFHWVFTMYGGNSRIKYCTVLYGVNCTATSNHYVNTYPN